MSVFDKNSSFCKLWLTHTFFIFYGIREGFAVADWLVGSANVLFCWRSHPHFPLSINHKAFFHISLISNKLRPFKKNVHHLYTCVLLCIRYTLYFCHDRTNPNLDKPKPNPETSGWLH